MALLGIGKSKVDIRVGKYQGSPYKLAIIGDVTLTRSINASSCLKFTCLRDKITPEKGEFIAFRLDDVHDVFYGTIENTVKHSKTIDVTCYDQIYFLANNTYTQNYGSLTASDLVIRMCDDFGFSIMDVPNIANTEYVIPDIILQSSNLLDVIVDALNITYKNTGKRFYLYDWFNNLCLDSGDNPETLKISTLKITHTTCKSYSYTEPLEGFFDKIVVHTPEEDQAERKTVEVQNDELVSRFGQRCYDTKINDKENADNVANTLLEDKSRMNYKLSVSQAYGDIRVFGGASVYVDFFSNGLPDQREYIRGWFRVNNVTHTFSKGTHFMDFEADLLSMDDDWDTTAIASSEIVRED